MFGKAVILTVTFCNFETSKLQSKLRKLQKVTVKVTGANGADKRFMLVS